MYETLIRMYYFFAMCKVQCLSLDLCNRMRMFFGSLLFSRAYCPFHMVEGLDVAMRGAGEEGWGKRRGRDRYVVICCCVVKCIVARGGWLPEYPISCQFRDLLFY